MPKTVFTRLFFWLSLIASQSVLATQITVVDRDNKPLENVVISLSSSGGELIPGPNLEIMDQVAYQFLPKVLLVSKGQFVDFPNSDNVRHHVYSFSKSQPFEIKMFAGSEAEPIQFNNPGIVILGCNMHDSMVGYIYVSDMPVNKITDKEGEIEISASDLANAELSKDNATLVNASLWHPLLSPTNMKRIDIQIDTTKAAQQIKLDIAQSLTIQPKNNGFSSKFRKTK